MILEEIIESLYDLTKPELRKLALECLLITDGPDKVEDNGTTNGGTDTEGA